MARPEWLFDDSPIDDPLGHGQRAVDFLLALKHPKSKLPGRQWQLDPWVERLVRRIYGPRDADGQRQVRTVFAMVPRGARKTTVGAALIALHTFGPERVPNGQTVSAAADAKQALIAYDEALGIVQAMPEVAAKLQVRVRDGVIDVRRCAWNGLLNGIDIYADDDQKLYATVMDPAVFDRIFWGRVTAVPAVVEGEAVR